MFKPTYADKKRIAMIGSTMATQAPGIKAAVCVDRGGIYEGKAEWYLAQFKEKHPALNAVYVGAMSADIDVIHVFSPACSQN